MNKWLILIAGPPATGKSYLLAKLLDQLSEVIVIVPDQIKQQMADNYGFASQSEKEKLELSVWQSYYQLIQTYAFIGVPYILSEYPFSAKQAPLLSAYAEHYGYQILTIRLVADFEVLWERRYQRDRSPERHLSFIQSHYHAGDDLKERGQADSLISKEAFRDIVQRRQYNQFVLGQLIEIDTNDLSHVDYQPVYQWIRDHAQLD